MVPTDIQDREFRNRRFRALFYATAILLAVIAVTFWPRFIGEEYLRAEKARGHIRDFEISFRSQRPSSVVISFRSKVRVNSATAFWIPGDGANVAEKQQVAHEIFEEPQDQIRVSAREFQILRIVYEPDQVPHITRVSINDSTELDLQDAALLFTPSATYVDRNSYTRVLSRALVTYNPVFGDLLIGVMAFGGIFVLVPLLAQSISFYLSPQLSRRRLRAMYIEGQHIHDSSVLSTLSLYQTHRDDRRILCRNARLAGPALGFLLTVSSLVEALAPVTTSAKDVGHFLNAIHIALISTFLGLSIRLLAIGVETLDNSRHERDGDWLQRSIELDRAEKSAQSEANDAAHIGE